MKLRTRALLVSAGVAALASAAFAATAPIANSKHNMNVVFGANTIKENQICLPCHAPHNQPDKTLDYLWNHVMPTNPYTLFGSGANYVGLDHESKMCLSCHDGSVAVDSYGSSGFVNTGTKKLGVATDVGGNSTAGFVVGAGGDLTHDHPVGVVYPGLSTSGTWTPASRFKNPTTGFMASTGRTKYLGNDGTTLTNYVGTDGVTAVSAVGGASIKLVKQSSSDTVGTVIGCVACHTPHSDTYKFLRIPNTNSQMCLSCHDK